ncbi:iron-siderophore ABC transporter permease [Salimicrobium jeotgali]|uniref:Ferrichrome ABC transporter permease subunit n=1 Tax=Salimicrobium jeotgali TaxID=1230341 RepID=K2GJL4_9BACI|nr:iron ABC transporter permease [Salimicrobium jeotgali]AKG05064.1 iron-siderophore ABC transporter permease [Salimicrobium jeotgali]EKE30624.1 ferrichrome ABC transporter permease subunit [Salimicrobium jeotgali]MBM7696859.1 iron complex transport system permease protein [Salimicrobium jeotgali]
MKKSNCKIIITVLAGLLLLTASVYFSLSIGAYTVSMSDLIGGVTGGSSTEAAEVVRTLRLPRALVAVLIGAGLAVAGAIMQAMTNNPLASPQIFGVNAGGSLLVVLAVVLFPDFSPSEIVYFAFIGAALGGGLVFFTASSGGMTPVKLALAGITIHMFLTSLIESVVIFNETSTEDVLFWLAGGVDGTDWGDVQLLLVWVGSGLAAAMLLSPSFTIMSLGEEVARGLGQRVVWMRMAASLIVVLLAGAAVSIAGPIGFVGLIIPHIARKLVGTDYKIVLPVCALFGGILLSVSDVLSRFIAFPAESPVGIVTALIGAPFFLYLAQKGGQTT